MIRKAQMADVAAIAATYTQLLEHEACQGSHSNWRLNIYPTAASAKQAVLAGQMYVMESEGGICASMVLNNHQAEEYAAMPWQYPAAAEQVLVIHTLCIPPSQSGKGLASQMLNFAKAFARDSGCQVIRLDTYAHNEPAKSLYQKHGFRIVGYAPSLLQGLIPEEQVFLEYALPRPENC